MAIDDHAARFLLACKADGADFGEVITLGHQYLWARPPVIQAQCHALGLKPPEESIYQAIYADDFFKWLGAQSVDSIDASDYEQATLIHDLNFKLGPENFARGSAVLDIGTLEHVFNFPQAIENCMNLLKVGGDFIGISPANNLVGHGFYQFSPELFFRIFSAENGFKVQRMILADLKANRWFEVADPQAVGARVTLRNCWGAYLMIWARKEADLTPFRQMPQQSDYSSDWKQSAAEPGNYAWKLESGPIPTWKRTVKRLIPRIIWAAYNRLGERFTQPEFSPQSAFTPTTPGARKPY